MKWGKGIHLLLFIVLFVQAASLAWGDEHVVTRQPGESVDAYIQRLYEAAKKEGEVVYYHSASKDEMDAIRAGWEKLFPDIKLTEVQASSGTILERALLEGRTGRVQADIYGGAAGDQAALAAENLSAVYTPANEEFIDPAYKFPDKPYTATGYLSFHITYNTDMVKEEDVPKTWEDFLDPKWQGKIAIDQEGFEWFCGVITYMGKEKGMAYMRALAKQKPKLIRGATHRTELLSAGSFPISLDLYGHRVQQFMDEGHPISALMPHPAPISAVIDMASVMKGAPHPNAARLMLEYFLMPEGQQVFLMQNKPGVRVKGVEHPYPKLIEGVEFSVLGPETVDFNECSRDFVRVFIRGR